MSFVPVVSINFMFDTTEIVVSDISDYAGSGYSTAKGIFYLKDPLGTVHYQNAGYATDDYTSEDTTYPATPSKTLSMPVNPLTLLPEKGLWEIGFKTEVDGGPTTFQKTFTYDFQHDNPTMDIDIEVYCRESMLVSKDKTSYGSNVFAQIWQHKIDPPFGSGLSTINALTKEVTVGPNIWTNVWTTELKVNTVWLYDTNLYVTKTVSGTLSKDIQCTNDLCDAFTCVKSMNDHYNTLLCSSTLQARDYFSSLMEAYGLLTLIVSSERCGDSKGTETYLAQLKKVAGLSGCNCGSLSTEENGLSTEIQPVGSAAGYVNVVGGSGITVTPVTVGGITTYTVALSGTSFVETIAISGVNYGGLSITQTTGFPNYAFSIQEVWPETYLDVVWEAGGYDVIALMDAIVGMTFQDDLEKIQSRVRKRYKRGSTFAAIVDITGTYGIDVWETPPYQVCDLNNGFQPDTNRYFDATILDMVGFRRASAYVDKTGKLRVYELNGMAPPWQPFFLVGVIAIIEGISLDMDLKP